MANNYESYNLDLYFDNKLLKNINIPTLFNSDFSQFKAIDFLMLKDNNIFIATTFGLCSTKDTFATFQEECSWDNRFNLIELINEDYFYIFNNFEIFKYSKINKKLKECSVPLIGQIWIADIKSINRNIAFARLSKYGIPETNIINYFL